MQYIDLSFPLDNNKDWAPWWARNKVKRTSHKLGKLSIWLLFRLSSRYLKNGLGWAFESISLSTHGTTHFDAPWHFSPVSEGKVAKTVDKIPLEWCFSDGVVLDMRGKTDGIEINVDDVKNALSKIKYTIKPLDIVLILTGNDKLFGTKKYFTDGLGVSAAATKWILEHGVKVVGIDSWGWDIPLNIQAALAKQNKQKDIFWAAHYVGIEMEYCHMEQLTNLDKLPQFGFKVCCFPLKVKDGSAGPARVVAMVET